MAYLIFLELYAALAAVILIRMFLRSFRELSSNHTIALPSTLALLLLMSSSIAVVMPILRHLMTIAAFHDGQTVSVNRTVSSAWLTFIGAILGLAYFAGRAWIHHINNESRTLSIAATSLGIILNFYFAAVAIDHARFYLNPESTATLFWGNEHGSDGFNAPDVKCNANYLFVRDFDKETVNYRCPEGFAIDPFSSTPFMPWPGYTEGDSTTLRSAIRRFIKNANK